MNMPRLYHSVALLLPDGTVWSAGSNPNWGTWENRMEIYKPRTCSTPAAAGDAALHHRGALRHRLRRSFR